MHPRSKRAANLRLIGTMALLVGFTITAITLASGTTDGRAYVLAGFLVVTGVGLRIEAAITEPSL